MSSLDGLALLPVVALRDINGGRVGRVCLRFGGELGEVRGGGGGRGGPSIFRLANCFE